MTTRYGRPLAKIVGLGPRRRAPSHADLRERMKRMAVGSEELVREDRNSEAGPA